MERRAFGLDAITARILSALGDLVIDVDDDDHIWRGAPGGSLVHRRHDLDAEAACDTLVDERRRHIPVAHHPRAAGESRPHHLVEVLRAISRHQQRFGRGRDRIAAVQQLAANSRTQGRRPRLERLHHLDATRAQPLRQRGDLRALAGALTTFDHDEHVNAPDRERR